MTLATATTDGQPSARIVLFKGITQNRVRFVTNYNSRKGRELEANPRGALVFYWPELKRQVRLEGSVRRAPSADSDAYFRSRPRESQLGAWASAQSEAIISRAELERRFAEAEARFRDREVERPPVWGIYELEPQRVELWVMGAHRLHDRFLYSREGEGWSVSRLCP